MVSRLVFVALILLTFLATGTQTRIAAQTATPSATDIQGCAKQTDKRFDGARPESLVLKDVDLLTQPQFGKTAKPIKLITIPKDARVVVFDIDDVERKWYRVLWVCDTFAFGGWVTKDSIKFFDKNANPKVAPPGCVQSITTFDSLNPSWKSTIAGRLVVVADLYRAPSTKKYDSFFYLTTNGKEVKDKDRHILTEGPFLANGEVINAKVSKGMVIGFTLTAPSPDIKIYATAYAVPEGCKWDV